MAREWSDASREADRKQRAQASPERYSAQTVTQRKTALADQAAQISHMSREARHSQFNTMDRA